MWLSVYALRSWRVVIIALVNHPGNDAIETISVTFSRLHEIDISINTDMKCFQWVTLVPTLLRVWLLHALTGRLIGSVSFEILSQLH